MQQLARLFLGSGSGLFSLLEPCYEHTNWATKASGSTRQPAAWDGEEPGLLGSTEWVETHVAELQKHAVAYINSDSNERGFLHASGSHDLERFINDVARDNKDPEKNMSVWTRAHLYRIARATNPEQRDEVRKRNDLRINALGDGSDYTAFLDHAGISALNIGFGGEDEGDQYHSIYDDFHWYTQFVDPKFEYEQALAEVGGVAIMASALRVTSTNSGELVLLECYLR